ncbi:MAG: Glu/Leu/Phe/Val dehydrogenase, partial [Polyangiaceae bacterium]|nr:Glu/Leu/Phe/Val dehydrogenase [Polyangiaceae bacterium]
AAGGGKCVVLAHPGLQRERALTARGRWGEDLGGLFRTAGDLGTTARDLEVMAAETPYVHRELGALGAAAGRGLVRCAEACAEALGKPGLRGLRVLVQGAGTIGSAAARAFHAAGAELWLSDLDAARADALAAELGATVVAPEDALRADVDLLSPCAVGGVVTAAVAHELRARALCGGANNLLASAEADAVLLARGIVHVPDLLASAGAVIAGIGRTVMGLPDPMPLVDALGDTAQKLLRRVRATGTPALTVAHAMAHERLGH